MKIQDMKRYFFMGLVIGTLMAFFFVSFPIGVIEIVYERY